ncbi:MAG: hypothetical protein Q4C42_10835, partial [Clostridia bacterium]|nr:hypothetical protein [Clostridia bacterium]
SEAGWKEKRKSNAKHCKKRKKVGEPGSRAPGEYDGPPSQTPPEPKKPKKITVMNNSTLCDIIRPI